MCRIITRTHVRGSELGPWGGRALHGYTASRLTELPSELTTELLPTVLAMLPPCDFFLRRRRRAGGSGGVRSS